LIEAITEEFINKEGHVFLINFLSNYADYERRLAGIKCLLVCSELIPDINILMDRGIMDLLLYIIRNENDNPLNIRETCFDIIGHICKDNQEN